MLILSINAEFAVKIIFCLSNFVMIFCTDWYNGKNWRIHHFCKIQCQMC